MRGQDLALAGWGCHIRRDDRMLCEPVHEGVHPLGIEVGL